MKLAFDHTTVFRYDSPVAHSLQKLRLTPREAAGVRVTHWSLELPGHAEEERDAYGNCAHLLRLEQPRQEICIHVHGEIDTQQAHGDVDGVPLMEPLSPLVFLRTTPLTQCTDAMRRLVEPLRGHIAADAQAGLQQLLHLLDRRGRPRTTEERVLSASEAFDSQSASPRDLAHVLVALCRQCHIPARYVSGYLLAADSSQPRISRHAWTEVWLEGTGWQRLDTAALSGPAFCHLPLAVGLDWLDTCPVRGLRSSLGQETLAVALDMQHMAQ